MTGYLVLTLALCIVFSDDGLAKKHHQKHHSKSHGHKIVGGEETDIKYTPYQAFLLLSDADGNNYQCGAAIINTNHLLTAAHCFKEYPITGVLARIGSSDKFNGGQQYSGTFEVHEKYDPISKDYDIAYVKTDEEMTFDGVNSKPVPIIDEGTSIPSGSILKVSGWGATSEGGDTSTILRAVELPSYSNEECNKIEKVTTRQFCAGYKEGGKDACQGDSGGPVVLPEANGADTPLLVGIVSAGYGCARPNQPGIFANITDMRDWVKKHTGS